MAHSLLLGIGIVACTLVDSLEDNFGIIIFKTSEQISLKKKIKWNFVQKIYPHK